MESLNALLACTLLDMVTSSHQREINMDVETCVCLFTMNTEASLIANLVLFRVPGTDSMTVSSFSLKARKQC